MAINIARMIDDLAKQAQGANGSKLSQIMSGISSLTKQGLGMLELARNMAEANRDTMTPEEEQALKDADDAAADIQRRVLGAMNDEAGDAEAQGKAREAARQKDREESSTRREGNAAFDPARKAAADRGKSR
jgi:hypothetical protein